MKKNFKKLSALLLALVFSMGSMMTAFADEPEFHVTYNGKDQSFGFAPGSEYTYTDLFKEFKTVMPGDELSDTIVIRNYYKGCDYIWVYMGAMLHDEVENLISDKVYEELEGDTYQEKLDDMNDFLHQLTLTVKHGDTVIYEGHPDELSAGFEGEMKALGRLSYGETTTLDVELSVPFELGNEYADRIGEVDWVFSVDEKNKGGGGEDPEDPEDPDDPEDPEDPEEPPIVLGDEDVKDPEEPPLVLGDEDEKVIEVTDAPKTGDDTVIMPYIALFAVGLVGTILTAVKKRKTKEE